MRLRIFGWIGIVWGSFIVLSWVWRNLVGGGSGSAGYELGQMFALAIGGLMLFAGIRTVAKGPAESTGSSIQDFATRYTEAWCSQSPARVASFFATHGSLTINGGTPSVGRAAITQAAQGFMTAFPDMVVTMDRLDAGEGQATYHWTLTGTNTGPGGTGRKVRISGHEEWVLGADGLILDSQGRFDEAEYRRQLSGTA